MRSPATDAEVRRAEASIQRANIRATLEAVASGRVRLTPAEMDRLRGLDAEFGEHPDEGMADVFHTAHGSPGAADQATQNTPGV